jgi:outer membrane lipoprotein SlyB
MAGAAASVIVVSLIGVAAITGYLPGTKALEEKRCPDCGVVMAVREVEVKGKGTGLGAVAGGVAGAVVGHEISRNRDAGTLVGAAGGAIAGHAIEGHVRTTKRFYVDVRMTDGTTHTVASASPPPWRTGDPVRLRDGRLVMRDARGGNTG